MSLPVTCTLTDIFGELWPFSQPPTPVRLVEEPTGLDGAPYEFDDIVGAGQAGVTGNSRIDHPNVIGCKVYIDSPGGGRDARDLLAAWRHANGRGWSLLPDGPLMKFEVEDTGRYQMVRLLQFKNRAEYLKIHSCGRAYDEVEYRSDESWWRTDPIVETFAAAEFPVAAVANFGDVDSWLHYKLEGPITSPKIGIGSELISLPSLTAGQWLDIETDPDLWDIRDQAGVDRTWIGERWHIKAPANTDAVPISITGTGTTSATKLTVTVPQLFWSAL